MSSLEAFNSQRSSCYRILKLFEARLTLLTHTDYMCYIKIILLHFILIAFVHSKLFHFCSLTLYIKFSFTVLELSKVDCGTNALQINAICD